jgi:endonuclease-3 related protein
MTAQNIFDKLYAAYGRPRWWSDEPYVVMIQAVLVQNTSWASVEKVTAALGTRLSPESVSSLNAEQLETLIRPCGFCKGKAAAILRLTRWYGRYGFDAGATGKIGQYELRNELLAVKGVGAETADVILVYALHRPSFVIDAYTRRFLERLGFDFRTDVQRRAFFETGIVRDYRLYGWYHWLILEHGISRCGKIPVCDKCAFMDVCKSARGLVQ